MTGEPSLPAGGAIDLHVDTLWRLSEAAVPWRQQPQHWPDLQVDPTRCLDGQVRLLLTACFTADSEAEPRAHVERMLDLADGLHEHPDVPFQRVTSPEDWLRLPAGAIGFLLTIENAISLEGSVRRLVDWYARGVRIVGITWNGHNQFADGVGVSGTEPGAGLSALGRELVELAAELGVAIDLSHLSRRGVDQVLEHETVAVIATHCNAYSLHEHPRNLTDDQLRRLAQRGGVVGLNFYPLFLAKEAASLDTVASHAAHMAEIMGPAHVSIGSDLDGITETPSGFSSYRDLPEFANSLRRFGFQESDIKGIFRENFLRWWRTSL